MSWIFITFKLLSEWTSIIYGEKTSVNQFYLHSMTIIYLFFVFLHIAMTKKQN